MQNYDATLKQLFRTGAMAALRELTGGTVERWLDVEFPRVQNTRMDLLGESGSGELIHIELQSSNDAAMGVRMSEYALGVYRICGSFPRQILVYVGQEPVTMPGELRGDRFLARWDVIDIL